MERTELTEEKRQLSFKLLDIIAKLEQVKVYEIGLIDIIPIAKGLKVIYKITWDQNRKWSRTIKYSDLANEI